MTRTEFRCSGFGGQGVITMAHVIGRAASVHAGLHATLTEAYGPEKTGGFARGDVVVSDESIAYPNVVDPDIVVTFAQDAYDRDADSVAQDGLVLVERDLVDTEPLESRRPDATVVAVPAVALAEAVGRKVVANVVMVGAVVEIVNLPPVEATRSAVLETVPEGTRALNERAFERGREAVREGEVSFDGDRLEGVVP